MSRAQYKSTPMGGRVAKQQQISRNKRTAMAQLNRVQFVNPPVGFNRFNNRVLPGYLRAGRQPELKFVDLAQTALTGRLAATPPVAQPILFPVQGAAAFNRIGQKITLKSLRVRGVVTNILTSVQQMARIIIVYDRQANAALPIWTDVIGAVVSGGGPSSTIMDGIQLANRDRFIILADEQYNLPSVTNTTGVLTNMAYPQEKNPSMFNFDRFIKLKDMETHFNNTNGGTFADIQTGSLSLFFAVQTTDSSWSLTWSARTRYTDA